MKAKFPPRWLPLDVARMWVHHGLEPLLAPSSDAIIPAFRPSNYLSLPLNSVLNIARYFAMKYVCFLLSANQSNNNLQRNKFFAYVTF